jgi:hypothetical protein
MRAVVFATLLACASAPEIRVHDLAVQELHCARVNVETTEECMGLVDVGADCTPHVFVVQGCGISATYDTRPSVHRIGAIGPDRERARAAWWEAFVDGGVE